MDDRDDRIERARAIRKLQTERQAEQRRTKAAEQLRENLLRRKGQARARRSGEADDTDGLPAAKMDEL